MILNVAPAVAQLDEHPEYWDAYTTRTAAYGSPHDVSDIWVRYNDIKNLGPRFNDRHRSVWYPCAKVLTEIPKLVSRVVTLSGATQLGGVLITRIQPGKQVRPHVDRGWHAEYYRKFAVQLKSAPGQRFHFEDSYLDPVPGEVYTFDNSQTHWVTNDTQEERMTLIICVRTKESV